MAFKLQQASISENLDECERKGRRTKRFPCSRELYAQSMAKGRLSTLKIGTPIDWQSVNINSEINTQDREY